MFNKRHLLRKTLVASVVAAAASAPAIAQERATALEEVIVTAQKRSESLQDTPISISAYSADSLEAMGVYETADVGAYTPNLNVKKQPSSSDNYGYSIRGVASGETSLLSEQTVGVYMDGVYIARNTGSAFDIVDLERIEILRGPQGALYGRNTIGGAINLITAKPAEEFAFKQKFSVGNRGKFRSNTTVDTGDLGNFYAKLSYNMSEHDGLVKNSALGNTLGANESDAYRIALRWTPSDDFTLDYTYDNSERKSNATLSQITHVRGAQQMFGGPIYQQAAAAASQDRRSQLSMGLSPDKGNTSDIEMHSLTMEWEFENFTFKSISAYRDWDSKAGSTEFESFQSDGVNVISFAGPVAAGTWVSPFAAGRHSTNEQWTQEFQFQGGLLDDRLQYTVGLFYFEEESYESNPQTVTLPAAFILGFAPNASPLCGVTCVGKDLVLPTSTFIYGAENDSTAVYGQFIYSATEQLDLTLGLRYTKDNKEVFLDKGSFQTNPDDSWSNFSPSLTANYALNDDISMYATYSTGYRAGGFNARAASVVDFGTSFDEENVTNYEFGIKSDWFDSRLRVNAAIFALDYQDAQVSQFKAGESGASSIISNAGELDTKGLELEITAIPFEGLTVIGSWGYIDTKYTEFISGRTDPVTASPAPSANADPLTGNEDISDVAIPAHAPQNSGSLILRYDFEPTSWGSLTAQIDAAYTGEFVYHAQLNKYDRSEEQTLINARMTLSDIPVSKGNLSVAAWVKNLNNEEYREWGIDFGSLGFTIDSFQELRSYGIDIVYEL